MGPKQLFPPLRHPRIGGNTKIAEATAEYVGKNPSVHTEGVFATIAGNDTKETEDNTKEVTEPHSEDNLNFREAPLGEPEPKPKTDVVIPTNHHSSTPIKVVPSWTIGTNEC